jgi:hypothetical protein
MCDLSVAAHTQDAIIAEKKALLKNSKDVYEFDRLSAELEGLEWLQRQIARLFWG